MGLLGNWSQTIFLFQIAFDPKSSKWAYLSEYSEQNVVNVTLATLAGILDHLISSQSQNWHIRDNIAVLVSIMFMTFQS